MQQLAPYMSLGTQLTMTVIVLGVVGWYVDEKVGSRPTWLITGVIVGSVVGFTQFFRTLGRLLRNDKERQGRQ